VARTECEEKRTVPFAEVDTDVRLFYCDLGEGPPIVLLHGWTMTHQVWDQQVLDLGARHRLILPDLRGHGDSDKPLRGYELDRHAADIDALISRLELGPVTLVGWSFGGMTAMRVAAAYPDRVHGLVLINAAGPKYLATDDFPYGHSGATLQEWLGRERQELAPWRRFCMEAMPRVPYDPLLTDWLWMQSMRTPSWAAAPMLEDYARADLRPELGRITAPTLILHGRHDVFCAPEAARFVAGAIPGARLIEFEDSGHSPQWEERDRFKAALDLFLERP
jgi:pimeloyl-ACP methyl ester carboxylesterase